MSPFLPDQTRLSQLHLRTANLERALGFYSDALGLEVVRGTGPQVRLSAAGEDSVLLVLSEDQNAAPRPPGSTGLCRLGIRYPRRQDLARAYRRLLKSGYPIAGATAQGASETICLSDADGHGVELYADRPGARDDLFAATEPSMDSASPPANTSIRHLDLCVADLAVAERFYGEFLGLAVSQRAYPRAVLFSAGGGHYQIGITRTANAVAAVNSVGLFSYRLEVPVAELLYCLSHRAPLLGYEARFEAAEPALLQIRDPNGNWLEVQSSARSEVSLTQREGAGV